MKSRKSKTAIGLTLGCRLNQADTALIFGRLEEAGFSIIKPQKDSPPDVVIINTCTVTANAARKSRQTARHFKRKYPNTCLIVTGCDCDKALADWEHEDAVDFLADSIKHELLLGLTNKHSESQKRGNKELTNMQFFDSLNFDATQISKAS